MRSVFFLWSAVVSAFERCRVVYFNVQQRYRIIRFFYMTVQFGLLYLHRPAPGMDIVFWVGIFVCILWRRVEHIDSVLSRVSASGHFVRYWSVRLVAHSSPSRTCTLSVSLRQKKTRTGPARRTGATFLRNARGGKTYPRLVDVTTPNVEAVSKNVEHSSDNARRHPPSADVPPLSNPGVISGGVPGRDGTLEELAGWLVLLYIIWIRWRFYDKDRIIP